MTVECEGCRKRPAQPGLSKCKECINLYMNEGIIVEGPKLITPANVIRWSSHWEELEGEGFRSKAHEFVLHHCLKYVGNDELFKTEYTWICLPLNTEEFVEHRERTFKKKPFSTDYNSTIYRIRQDNRRFKCSCQGWHTKEKRGEGREDGCQCSHVLALFLWFKLSKEEKEKYKEFDTNG